MAWIVPNTKCHVKAASIANLAVSLSLISHTSIISGSCLKRVLRPLEKSYHISLLTWDWLIHSILYSTGSSSVDILCSIGLKLFSIAYNVVVFQDPVGPLTSTNPSLYFSALFISLRLSCKNPRLFIFKSLTSFLRSLITIFSPLRTGKVDTLISTSSFLFVLASLYL